MRQIMDTQLDTQYCSVRFTEGSFNVIYTNALCIGMPERDVCFNSISAVSEVFANLPKKVNSLN